MKSMRAIQFIKAMKGQGLSERGAEEILSVLDEREGELATKIDIVRLEEGQKRLEASIDQLRTSGKKDIEQVEKRLEAGIRGNRWAITIAISAIGLVFTAIITGSIFFWGQISDMRADIRELLQGQQSEQQAERTGNSAKQEGRISAADQRGS